jgi:hypothetical protein
MKPGRKTNGAGGFLYPAEVMRVLLALVLQALVQQLLALALPDAALHSRVCACAGGGGSLSALSSFFLGGGSHANTNSV